MKIEKEYSTNHNNMNISWDTKKDLRLAWSCSWTNTIHMTISVSWRLNILSIMFKIISLWVSTLFARIHVKVGILLTCRKHLLWPHHLILKACTNPGKSGQSSKFMNSTLVAVLHASFRDVLSIKHSPS